MVIKYSTKSKKTATPPATALNASGPAAGVLQGRVMAVATVGASLEQALDFSVQVAYLFGALV